MIPSGIVPPGGTQPVPGWAKPAIGPGGVVSDAKGRVLVNVLQQNLDHCDEAAQPPLPVTTVNAANVR